MIAWEETRYRLALKRARERRWTAPGKSTVRHPKYGKVVVPHASKLAALDNAAEYWNCDVSEITRDATVMRYERGDGPLVRPREFCGGKRREQDKNRLGGCDMEPGDGVLP